MAIWMQSVRRALYNLKGSATLAELYVEVSRIRKLQNDSLPESTKAIIRARLEEQSSDSEIFDGKNDWFAKLQRGAWALRPDARRDYDFEAWLTGFKHYKPRTATNYVTAIHSISKELSTKSSKVSLFSITNVSDLEAYRDRHFQNPVAVEKNKRGNSMYSNAFERYIEFASHHMRQESSRPILLKSNLPSLRRQEEKEAREGEQVERTILSYKRNRAVVAECKQEDNYTCQSCDFHHDDSIVEAHHLLPLHMSKDILVDKSNLITLCPTCHRVAHKLLRQNPSLITRAKLLPQLQAIMKK